MQKVRAVTSGAIARFSLVGLLNTAVGLSAIAVARQLLGLNEYLANAIGFALGLLCGFAGHFLWTFKSRQRPIVALWRYLGAVALSYLANICLLAMLLHHTTLPGFVAQAGAIACYSLCFFLLCRYFVFAS